MSDEFGGFKSPKNHSTKKENINVIHMATKTYKYKSKIATAISFIAALVVYIGKDGLTQVMPTEYANIIPIIVFIAGYILAQSTENKRVEIAEQMIYEKLDVGAPDPANEYENLNQEYNIPNVGDDNNGGA